MMNVIISFVSVIFMYLPLPSVAAGTACGAYSYCDVRCMNLVCSVNVYNNYGCCNGCNNITIGGVSVPYYWWADGQTCAQYCPVRFYQNSFNAPGSINNLICSNCDPWCLTCTNQYNYTCSSCQTNAYQLNSTACYNLLPSANSYTVPTYSASGLWNPCIPPYYGLQITMTCILCPQGCASCNIFLQWQMPGGTYPTDHNMNNVNCSLNTLCTNFLRCYTCNAGYTLINGQCLQNNQCFSYSFYNSTSTSFTAGNCACFNNYYGVGSGYCMRCSIDCLTCFAQSNCLTCPFGITPVSNNCTYNTTFVTKQYWGNTINLAKWTKTDASNNPISNPNPVGSSTCKPVLGFFNVTNCEPTVWVLGYWGYNSVTGASYFPSGAKLKYTSTGYGTNHYGLHFRATILFIDSWNSSMSIIVQQSSIDRFSHTYQLTGVPGEYLCGFNTYDHIDVIDGWFNHSTDAVNLVVKSNWDGMQWGMKEVIIHVMKCHASCTTCNGPLATNCKSCANANEVLVNGDCVCDSANGWYLQSGACTQTCTSPTKYQNSYSRSCVSDCNYSSTSPYSYKFYNSSSTVYSCVINCPATYYKMQTNYTCVLNCYDPAITPITSNYFKYVGKDLVCYQTCPNGTYGDPTSGYCVRTCPKMSNTTEEGYFALGQFCTLYCNSSTFAYPPTRTCMTYCPAGFYMSSKVVGGVTAYLCEQTCSFSLSGRYPFADNYSMNCTNLCPNNTYGDIISHTCDAYCNTSAFAQFLNISGAINRTCQTNCSVANGLYGNPLSGFCVGPTKCPTGYYGDNYTYQCVQLCTNSLQYGNSTTGLCSLTCPGGYRYNYTKTCVTICPNVDNNSVATWGDPTYGYCIANCSTANAASGIYYGDIQKNRVCVKRCSSSPAPSFGLNNLCVYNCSSTTWGDPYHTYRICTTSCTMNPTNQSYGENTTRLCVKVCPNSQFANNVSTNVSGVTVPLCSYSCDEDTSTFGDITTNKCMPHCPPPYYGDVTGNRTCVLACPVGYFAQNTTAAGVISADRICVQKCDFGWADNTTRTCAIDPSGCTQPTFTHESNHTCVFAIDCIGFGDPLTMTCGPQCQNDTVHNSFIYFGDNSTHMCVLICPQVPSFFGSNHSRQCQATCYGTQVRDQQYMRRCVKFNLCSRTPVALYGDALKGTCVTAMNCSDDYYADNHTNTCNQICSAYPYLYGDNVTKQCVSVCEWNYYALNQTFNSTTRGICSLSCPVPQYADNETVQCTPLCTDLTYGVNYTSPELGSFGVCQVGCPVDQFARDGDNLCVFDCGSGLWGDYLSRTCKKTPHDCPDGYFADNQTNLCVAPINCSMSATGIQYVAQNQTKECVPQCPNYTANASAAQSYADMDKQWCVAVCPYYTFGYNTTLTCQPTCLKYPVGHAKFQGSFADKQLRVCVQICSDRPIPTFGEKVNYTCVEAIYCLPAGTSWAQTLVSNRQCLLHCPGPVAANNYTQYYADNVTWQCVSTCPTLYFGDLTTGYGACVYNCPAWSNGSWQFSDNSTKLCVLYCPSPTWGDVTIWRCVYVCPASPVKYYAQLNSSRYCVHVCNAHTWGQQIKRTCLTSATLCPVINGSYTYADQTTHLCVKTCPSIPDSPTDLWGENVTRMCLNSCVLANGSQSGFKWNITKVCIDICPQQIFKEGSYSDQGRCYYVCITPNYYRDPQSNRSCVPQCSFSPLQYYSDPTTMRCLLSCPSYPNESYAYDVNRTCQTQCPFPTIQYSFTRQCVQICPNETFYNNDTNECLQLCPQSTTFNKSYYADSTLINSNMSICVVAEDCPPGYYGDSITGNCEENCTQMQWIYGKHCVQECPNGYYGNFVTMECVKPIGCPNNTYADNASVTCVSQCNGSFADLNNHVCVDVCPVNYYADSWTRKCSLNCTNTATVKFYKNLINQTCVSSCDQERYLNPLNNSCQVQCPSPYFADDSTQVCVSVCPSVPPLFGQKSTLTCVSECLNSSSYRNPLNRMCVSSCPTNYYRDNITRFCVNRCVNTTYASSRFGYCVYNCSPQYSSNEDNTCKTSCSSPYFRDPTTFQCVLVCPLYPVTYYRIADVLDRRCNHTCPNGTFRDMLSFNCVSLCPPSPATFADTTSGSCLAICSNGYYSSNATRTCQSSCPAGMFADPYSKQCVYKCTNGTDLYGDNSSSLPFPKCVSLCSSGTFANPYTLTCVSTCNTNPISYGFDNTTVRKCLTSCPYPYVIDATTQQCKMQCNYVTVPYIDQAAQKCVAKCTSKVYMFSYMPTGSTTNGNCVKFCPNGTFSLLTNNSCVKKCPNGLYGQTTNNTCMSTCSLTDNKFADPITNLCTDTCTTNSVNDTFGQLYTRTCVKNCMLANFSIADNHTRTCVPRCTQLDQFADFTTGYCVSECPYNYFADNNTQTCVSNCSQWTLMYGYVTDRVCVASCKQVSLYADDATRLCVSSFNCSGGYFGLDSSAVCVVKCPTSPDLYGDPASQKCKSLCDNSTTLTYADPTSRTCVTTCPSLPALFSDNITVRCLAVCPTNSYADNYTRRCIKVCSIKNIITYADNTTQRCVSKCPVSPNYFGSNKTYQCVKLCPSTPSMFADYSTRICVLYCPDGVNRTFADPTTRFCVKTCPSPSFNQNSTRQCLNSCLTGYRDSQSRYCIAICPPYTYGYNGTMTCFASCPIINNVYLYAEDHNNMCMNVCLAAWGTYRDPSTYRCVKICPINQSLYADPNHRLCVPQCSQSPLMFADDSTRYCVGKCPKIPSLFGELTNRTCVAVCPNNTWADTLSRTCLSLCNTNPIQFGDNGTWSCVRKCPLKPMTWADPTSFLCVYTCPSAAGLYADNVTQSCVEHCPNGTFADPTTSKCVNTCPEGWYAQNSSKTCMQGCPWRQFADSLLNWCVSKCSVDPIFYGNPDTLICVPQCPSQNHSYGNPLTQQCVNFNNHGVSGCTPPYFADNSTRLCKQVCPMANKMYGDNSTWACVSVCPPAPPGLKGTWADNSTMRCVAVCPSYPEYYAQQYSRVCVKLCLKANQTFTGTFADNSTRLCVTKCPIDPDYFSDNSTRRCVLYCPQNPLTFADNSTRRCVTTCPSTPDIYGDLSTLRCVPDCPIGQLTYADYSTRMCVKVCPQSHLLFGQNSTMRCVTQCPNNSYADNSSRYCIAVCPAYMDTYADPSTNKCVARCPPSPDLYADRLTQTCVERCPNGSYAQTNSRRCLAYCPSPMPSYADNLTNRCVPVCPISQATYGDNSTGFCVLNCPMDQFTFADNITRICLTMCNNVSNGGFADNETRVCVQKCSDGTFGDITTRRCVEYCPDGWFGQPVNNTCVMECPAPFFADNSTWKCVLVCPVSQLFFGQNINRTCVSQCPNGTYASAYSQRCQTICPSYLNTSIFNASVHWDTFGLNTTKVCVDECPLPLFGWPVGYVCVIECPFPWYDNLTDHRCYKCPDECASCTNPLLCLTCAAGHYLYSGTCVESCPTFPVITYANPNLVCGTSFQCTQGYFALNTTKSCVRTCPPGFFKNLTMQTCDACMRGCIQCTNSSSCLTCNSNTSIWNNYVCYLFCSPGNKYYTSTGCINNCLDGTYLSLVTCLACSQVCAKCFIQAQNCLVCASGYYIANNLCVNACPTNTKAILQNGSLFCQSCSIVNCTTQALTYSLTQFVDNFQYKLQLQFNQPVNITQQIDKVFQLMVKNTSRRLLVVSYTYLNYTIYDYGNGLYTFVLNDYNPSSSTQLQLQILNPSAIVSQSGSLPETTRTTITVQTAFLYSASDYHQGIVIYTQIIIGVAIIILVLSFWTNQSIWMPIFDFMQLLFALFFININFSPDLMYTLGAFQNAGFTFLPNFFASSIPKAAYDSSLNNNIYSILRDFTFLRTMGYLYTFFLVLGIALIIIFILSKKCWNKDLKKWAKGFIRQYFWKKHLHGINYLLFLPTLLIGIFNMTNYKSSQPVFGFSIFSSYVFMIPMIAIPIYFAYKIRKLTKDYPIAYLMMQKAYNFILNQPIVLIQNKIHYFTHQKNEVDLTNARQPRINELLIFPYTIQTKVAPFQLSFPLLSYLYKLLTVIFLVVAFANPIVQVFLLILLNIVFSIYFIAKRPFFAVGKKEFNNIVYAHNLIVIVIILIVLMAFGIMNKQLSQGDRVLIGDIIVAFVLYGITANLAYMIYRFYQYAFMNWWKPFVKSELFALNYTVQHFQLVKKYEDAQNKIYKQTKSREQFLEAIKIDNNEGLANMIRQSSVTGSSKDKIKGLKLRPNQNQIATKDITQMFNTLHNQRQKSHKSIGSSDRLSKNERKKVRDIIFSQKQDKTANKLQEYQKMELISEAELENQEESEAQETEYEFQYIQEEYPQGTPMQEIMKGCKKGEIVLPF